MSATGYDPGQLLERFVAAGVRFVVVVGDPSGGPLRLVVSRHPANLSVLGQVLERVGASLRPGAGGGEEGPQRLGDQLGALDVSTPFGDVALLFGPTGASLYAASLGRSSEGVVGGVPVRQVGSVPTTPAGDASTAERLSRRLGDLVDALAERLERERRSPTDPGP